MRRALLVLGLVLAAPSAAADPPARQRLLPGEYDFSTAGSAGTGTSGIAVIQTIVLKGDPTKAGLYTIMLRIPAHTRIAAHTHPDDRIATVISGTWYFGYGKEFDAAACAPCRRAASTPNRRATRISRKPATAPSCCRSRATVPRERLLS